MVNFLLCALHLNKPIIKRKQKREREGMDERREGGKKKNKESSIDSNL